MKIRYNVVTSLFFLIFTIGFVHSTGSQDKSFYDIDKNISHSFQTIHNYIDHESNIIRKGAVSAKKGEQLLIPINMRDGSLLCVGKGNPDWNCSAPHGAGRLFSRGAAKQNFTVEDVFAADREVRAKIAAAHS